VVSEIKEASKISSLNLIYVLDYMSICVPHTRNLKAQIVRTNVSVGLLKGCFIERDL